MSRLLIDANNLLHRILHVPAQAGLRTSTGLPTGGVYGALRVLKRTAEDFAVQDMAVVWDHAHSRRRKTIYPDYKAGRTRDENYRALFIDQKKRLVRLLDALGVPTVELPGHEADDVIFHITSKLRTEKWVVMSEDKDLLQVVDDHCQVWRPIAQSLELHEPVDRDGYPKHLVRVDNFAEYTGVRHGYYKFWKTLVGDSSDNVPGVLGEKTALIALKNMKEPNLVGLFDALTNCTQLPRLGRYYQTALDNWPDVVRNFKLLDLAQECLTEDELDSAIQQVMHPFRQPLDERTIAEQFHELEFKSLLGSLAQWLIPFRKLHS